MTMKVLQQKHEISAARQTLRSRGVSCTESMPKRFLRRLGVARGLQLGDDLKSWDVLETLHFIESHVQKDGPVLDIGCYASEIIVALHKAGFTKLVGADLNPDLKSMPYQDDIRYEVTNFMQTKFADAQFRAITSISVIEHGFDPEPLLAEVSRLLQSGGYFVASFDYWPEKIDTSGTKFFGMDWLIFSQQDVCEFVRRAAAHGLKPVGEMQFQGKDAPIACAGKSYTFGWLVLQKSI